ncbi:MAG: MotE family protein [Thermodesulfobacteriota bacterium]
MRRVNQVIVASLFTVKIAVGCLLIYQIGFDSVAFQGSAIASEGNKVPDKEEEASSNSPPISELREHGTETTVNAAIQNREPAEDEELDLNFLMQKRAQLKKREQEIEKREHELLSIQEDLNKKIAALTQLRDEIRSEIERKKNFNEMRLRHIVKAYSAMRPQQAAKLIEKLDMEFAIELLSNMKVDIVGNILSFLDAQKAATISEELAKGK